MIVLAWFIAIAAPLALLTWFLYGITWGFKDWDAVIFLLNMILVIVTVITLIVLAIWSVDYICKYRPAKPAPVQVEESK